MIQKMNMVSIAAPVSQLDKIVSDYIMNSEIHLENPVSVLGSARGLTQFPVTNPYEDILRRFTEVFDYAGIPYEHIKRSAGEISTQELQDYITVFDQKLHTLKDRALEIEKQLKEYQPIIDTLSPIINANVKLDSLIHLRLVKFRFGRMPLDSYRKLEIYLGDLEAFFEPVSSDNTSVWGFYFIPVNYTSKVDSIFASLNFERIRIGGDAEGTPKEIINRIEAQISNLKKELEDITIQNNEELAHEQENLVRAFAKIKFCYDSYNVRKYVAYSKHSFYLTGWMSEENTRELSRLLEKEKSAIIVVEDIKRNTSSNVPTRLKNPKIFKPFEEFVKMYGLPSYNETDPTCFLAMTYILMFGMMFGDVGHGLTLFAVGLIMIYLKKGGFLAKILPHLGISSIIFGVLYGCFFGFEGHEAIIQPLWFTPSENMNKILIITVGMGAVLIIISMLLNVLNGIKQKNWGKIFFSQNGLAGLTFYVVVLYTTLNAIMNSGFSVTWYLITLIAVPLLLIFLQKPLGRMLEKQRERHNEKFSSFAVESGFELFEIVLSFVTNTISFVRVGAFALNHAGMMSIVLIFMRQTTGTTSLIIAVLGNILVIALEGLIVGIQVLRLNFYEMFGKFYSGEGREFKSNF